MDWLAASKNFILIAQTGSFAEAARKRYTSSSALSKQIAWLEDQLQVKLLHRTTRHLSLTAAGETFYQRAKQIHGSIECLHTELKDTADTISGKIKVSCPLTSSHSYIASLLPRFVAENPHVQVEVISCSFPCNIIAEGYDLAIRRTPADDSQLEHRYLGNHQVQVYASPEYLAEHGEPKTPLELQQHNCLVHEADIGTSTWQFADGEKVEVAGNYASNHLGMVIQAAIQGLGLVQVSDTTVVPAVQEGKLIPILEEYTEKGMAVYAVYPKQIYQPRAVTACLDFLEANKFCSGECD